MEEAENLCDYIVIMDNGIILKEGTLNQLLEEETNEKVVEFTAENGQFHDFIQSDWSAIRYSSRRNKRKRICNSTGILKPNFLLSWHS